MYFLTIAKTTITQGGKSLSRQNQNIKLVNSSSFKSNRLLFLEIKCHKESCPHWLLRSLDIVIEAKVFESD